MGHTLKKVYLCRHGETDWSVSRQHTGMTDLSLTKNGIREGKCLKKALKDEHFDSIFCSPLKRAQETARWAGYAVYELDDGLLEWNYGDFEGLTTQEIRERVPTWNIFDNGAQGGESIQQIEKRAKFFIEKLRKLSGNVLLFSSGHISRVLGAVWVGLPAHHGKYLALSTASLSVLAYEHEYPVIQSWNNTDHL